MDAHFWIVTTAVLVPLTLVASWIDFADRKVPNVVNVTLLLLGFAARMIWFGPIGAWDALLGSIVGFVPLFLLCMMQGMGAGDVKLMAAIGAWMGWKLTLVSFCAGVIIGVAIGVVMIVTANKTTEALVNLRTIAVKMSSVKTAFSDYGSVASFGKTTQKLPYGVPLTIGTLLVLICQSPAVGYRLWPWE